MLVILSFILTGSCLKYSTGVRLANVPTGLWQIVVLFLNGPEVSNVHSGWSRSYLFASGRHVLHKFFGVKFELSAENRVSVLLAHERGLSTRWGWLRLQCSIGTWPRSLWCLTLLKFSKRGRIKCCLKGIKTKTNTYRFVAVIQTNKIIRRVAMLKLHWEKLRPRKLCERSSFGI